MRKIIIIPKEELEEMYINQRLSAEKISKRYNCSSATIIKILRRNNISVRSSFELNIGRKSSAETKDKISKSHTGLKVSDEIRKNSSERMKKLYAEGKFINPMKGKKRPEVAEMNKLKRLNLPEKEIIKMYLEENYRIPNIAKKYNVSRTAISNLLKRNNIKFKEWDVKGKTWEELYGKERTKNIKERMGKKISKLHKGIPKTELAKKRMSETRKRMYTEGILKPNSGCFKKGQPNLFKGRKHTDISKRNMGLSRTGKKNPKCSETKKRLFREGKIKCWNTGLTKENDERVKKGAEKLINNKCYKNPERSKKISILSKERFKNHPELRENMRLFQLGRKASESTKAKMREKRKFIVLPKKDTTIEVKIQKFLKKLGIEFLTHQYMHIEHGYQCDILIPSMNLVIEAFGTYWHKYPLARPIDNQRCIELRKAGYKVLVFWENEIRPMHLDEFRQKMNIFKINNFISQK